MENQMELPDAAQAVQGIFCSSEACGEAAVADDRNEYEGGRQEESEQAFAAQENGSAAQQGTIVGKRSAVNQQRSYRRGSGSSDAAEAARSKRAAAIIGAGFRSGQFAGHKLKRAPEIRRPFLFRESCREINERGLRRRPDASDLQRSICDRGCPTLRCLRGFLFSAK